MAYAEPEQLQTNDIELVYVAGKTSEAKAVEHLLTEMEFVYTLISVPFLRTSIVSGVMELSGLGFYVSSEQAPKCRELLQNYKFHAGLVLGGGE